MRKRRSHRRGKTLSCRESEPARNGSAAQVVNHGGEPIGGRNGRYRSPVAICKDVSDLGLGGQPAAAANCRVHLAARGKRRERRRVGSRPCTLWERPWRGCSRVWNWP
jgi:hypothetical protein